MNMRVSDFMIENPICVDKQTNLKSLQKLLNVKGYSHLPVVEEGKLIGIVSKTDLMSRFLKMLDQTSGKNYTSLLMEFLKVEDIMTANPIITKRGDDIDYAIELLLQGEFHSLVVVNDLMEVEGLITSYDLLKALYSETLKKKKKSK